ncbi:MAG TPA: UDP-N-acetylmuramate dehydrogenase [Bellilinea sp.]|nr:UDP-N-acetylmuramate dehydrogenase [Bellilinea sp.]
MAKTMTRLPIKALREQLGPHLQENVPMSSYTTARVGGNAAALLAVGSGEELEMAVRVMWQMNVPFFILGSGANLLVSDQGIDGVVILNRAHQIKVDASGNPPSVWAESGAILGTIARRAALRGLGGFEWAATVPGTLGGALYGNAGAFGGDMQHALILAEILHPVEGRQFWTPDKMQYEYRSSVLKRNPGQAVILAARLRLQSSTEETVKAAIAELSAKRRSTQPPGASLGSMFKNPAGDYAGRLIEAAGLKGTRIGGVQVSEIHANFFVNNESATASDYWQLIQLVQRIVHEKFGIRLELEIEPVGEWDGETQLVEKRITE